MLTLRGLSKIYCSDALQFHALRQVDLQVNTGEFVAILGPSGAGKTTLLNVLGLLENFDSGELRLNDHSVAHLSEIEKAQVRCRSIGFVFQAYNLIPDMTVEENLSVPLYYGRLPAAERRQRVAAALEQHSLQTRRSYFPRELSGGQQQRVAIARALIMHPQLVLADEPTGNLDSLSARQVMQRLRTLNEQGTTVVMVTHSEELARYADRRLYMLDGRLNGETQAVPRGPQLTATEQAC